LDRYRNWNVEQYDLRLLHANMQHCLSFYDKNEPPDLIEGAITLLHDLQVEQPEQIRRVKVTTKEGRIVEGTVLYENPLLLQTDSGERVVFRQPYKTIEDI
jgi:hypothetical protein